jgi:hypothetical protein
MAAPDRGAFEPETIVVLDDRRRCAALAAVGSPGHAKLDEVARAIVVDDQVCGRMHGTCHPVGASSVPRPVRGRGAGAYSW